MENKQDKNQSIFSWVLSILFAVGLVLVIRTFLFTPMIVDGASMEPTLHDHERIFVSKTITWTGKVNRQEIVIIKGEDAETRYVKRVIGLPGDVIQVKNDELYVNGKRVKEPYLKEYKKAAREQGIPLTEDFGPVTVPKDRYFVMGDNRPDSIDSRERFGFSLGFIDKNQIIGKSKFVFYPFKNARKTE